MKVCSRCKEKKLLAEFSKDKTQTDGHRNRCKVCINRYYIDNKEIILSYQKNYYDVNKDLLLIKSQEYYEANRDSRLIQMQEYQIINKDKIADRKRNYQKNNKDKINAIEAKRRASKLKATPNWLTEQHFEQIEKFYSEAQSLKLLTGLEYHVDHIVPLQGKNVCGLHVSWNLQVIPAKENISKSNNLEKDHNET